MRLKFSSICAGRYSAGLSCLKFWHLCHLITSICPFIVYSSYSDAGISRRHVASGLSPSDSSADATSAVSRAHFSFQSARHSPTSTEVLAELVSVAAGLTSSITTRSWRPPNPTRDSAGNEGCSGKRSTITPFM
eukprot:Amastigsp_a509161_23.p3 type:complete len:134 gc:universal Amastigsp_a509161_23:557-958(+)